MFSPTRTIFSASARLHGVEQIVYNSSQLEQHDKLSSSFGFLHKKKISCAGNEKLTTSISRANRITLLETKAILDKITHSLAYVGSLNILKLEQQKQCIEQILGVKAELCLLNHQELATLEKGFKKIAALLPQGKEAELAFVLGRIFKAEHLEANKDINYASRLAKFHTLSESGAEKIKELNVRLDLNAGLATENIQLTPSLGAGVGMTATARAFADDEGQFVKEVKIAGIGAAAGSIGIKISDSLSASVSARSELSFAKGRGEKWNDVKSFIDTQGCSIEEPNPKLTERFCRAFRAKKGLVELQKVQQSAAESGVRLNQLAESLQLKQIKACAPFPAQPLPKNIRTTYKSAKINATAELSLQPIVKSTQAIEGIFSHIDTKQRMPESFYNVVKREPEKISQLPCEAYQYINTLYHSFLPKKMASLADKNKAIIKALNLLKKDWQHYIELVAKYDYFKKTAFDHHAEKYALKAQKQGLESYWLAKGRHQFIFNISASLAWLTTKSIDVNQKPFSLLTDEQIFAFEQLATAIENPAFRFEQKKVDKSAKFRQEVTSSLKDTHFRLNLTVGCFSGAILITKSTITHANNLRAGEYLDFEIIDTVNAGFEQLSQSQFTSALLASLPAGTLPEGFSFTPDLVATGEISQHVRFFKPKYCNNAEYKGCKNFRKQFTRNRTGNDFLAKLPISAEIAPSISLAASLQGQRIERAVVDEKINAEDLTYTRMRFNRFYLNHKDQAHNSDWDAFFQKHESNFKKMFIYLSEDSSAIAKELDYFFAELLNKSKEKAELVAFKEIFDKKLNAFANDKQNMSIFFEIKTLFTELLAKLFVVWQQDYLSHWQLVNFDKKAKQPKKDEKQLKFNAQETRL